MNMTCAMQILQASGRLFIELMSSFSPHKSMCLPVFLYLCCYIILFARFFFSFSPHYDMLLLHRAANVFSCAYLVNLVRPANRKIPVKHQKALWYSGRYINYSSQTNKSLLISATISFSMCNRTQRRHGFCSRPAISA